MLLLFLLSFSSWTAIVMRRLTIMTLHLLGPSNCLNLMQRLCGRLSVRLWQKPVPLFHQISEYQVFRSLPDARTMTTIEKANIYQETGMSALSQLNLGAPSAGHTDEHFRQITGHPLLSEVSLLQSQSIKETRRSIDSPCLFKGSVPGIRCHFHNNRLDLCQACSEPGGFNLSIRKQSSLPPGSHATI